MRFSFVLSLLNFLAPLALASQFTFDILPLPNPVLSNEDSSHAAARTLHQGACLESPSTELVMPSLPKSEPWTQKPCCIKASNDSDIFCVYTSSTFARGRGISLFTTPSIAEKIAQSIAFANPEALEGINVEPHPSYIAQGRDIGLVVNRTLHRGDNLFSYTPVVIVNRAVFDVFTKDDLFRFQNDVVDRLPAHSRDLFLALPGHLGGDKVDDIIHTQSFQFNIEDQPHNIIIPETSRIKHNCRPNAHYYFDVNTLTHYIHAVRTIHVGEELSISFITGTMQRAERQATIKQIWGFDCSCSLCTQREIFIRESDERLKLISGIKEQLNDWSPNSRATPEMAETLISLYEQERLHAPIAEAYTHAALEYNSIGQEQRALKYAALAVEFSMLNSGPEFQDVLVMRDLMRDPKGHWSWLLRDRLSH